MAADPARYVFRTITETRAYTNRAQPPRAPTDALPSVGGN